MSQAPPPTVVIVPPVPLSSYEFKVSKNSHLDDRRFNYGAWSTIILVVVFAVVGLGIVSHVQGMFHRDNQIMVAAAITVLLGLAMLMRSKAKYYQKRLENDAANQCSAEVSSWTAASRKPEWQVFRPGWQGSTLTFDALHFDRTLEMRTVAVYDAFGRTTSLEIIEDPSVESPTVIFTEVWCVREQPPGVSAKPVYRICFSGARIRVPSRAAFTGKEPTPAPDEVIVPPPDALATTDPT